MAIRPRRGANLIESAPPPPEPRPEGRGRGRRWLVWALLVGLAGLAASPLLREAAYTLRQRLASGNLEWRTPDGWTPVRAEDALRRQWTGVAFPPAWRRLAPGLDEAEVRVRRPPNPLEVQVVLMRVDPSFWRFRVWGRPDLARGAVDELAAEAGLVLALNASYYSEDGPLGLLVTDGASRGRQGRTRAAHFVVPNDGRPRIVNEKNAELGHLEQGFQGFPAIMTAGNTYAYMRYGGRGFDVYAVDRRSAACTLAGGDVVLLVTDTLTNGLSLSELATVLGGIGCRDAMGFDGGSSTGMYLNVGAHHRVVANLESVPVIVGIEGR